MDIFSYTFHDASVLSLHHENEDLWIKMCTFQVKENCWKRVDLDIRFINVRQVDSWSIDIAEKNKWRPLSPNFTIDDIENLISDWLLDTDETGVYTFEDSFRVFCDHAEVISAVEIS